MDVTCLFRTATKQRRCALSDTLSARVLLAAPGAQYVNLPNYRFPICVALAALLVVVGLSACRKKGTITERRAVRAHLRDLADTYRKDPKNKKPLNDIIVVLHGNWSFAASSACYVLRDLGPLAAPAVPDLIKALNSGDPLLENSAPRALGAIGPAAAPAVPVLIAKLKDEKGDTAWYSADALGEIGEPALVAIPALEIAAQSKWEAMERHANAALEKLRKLQDDPNKQ